MTSRAGRLRGTEGWFHADPDADLEAARTAASAAIHDPYAIRTPIGG